MRQSCSENGAQNKKPMHPKTKNPCKIHAEIHAPNLCVKVCPKKGLKTNNPCTPKRKIHARIRALIFAPPSLEKGIAHATQLCNRKTIAYEKAQPYGRLCSTSLSPRPWGPIRKAWGQTALALSQQVRIQSEQQRKNRRALAVKQEEGRPAASAGLRGRFP